MAYLSGEMDWLGPNIWNSMDKRKKTFWEKRMRRWQIALVVLFPLLFGLVFWLIARLNSHP
jgi:hypothetical protein